MVEKLQELLRKHSIQLGLWKDHCKKPYKIEGETGGFLIPTPLPHPPPHPLEVKGTAAMVFLFSFRCKLDSAAFIPLVPEYDQNLISPYHFTGHIKK